MANVVGPDELVRSVEVPTIPELVVEAKDQLLVRFEHLVGHVRVSVPGATLRAAASVQTSTPRTGLLVSASLGSVTGSLCATALRQSDSALTYL